MRKIIITKAIEKKAKDNEKGRWQKGDLEVVKLVINGKVVKAPRA